MAFDPIAFSNKVTSPALRLPLLNTLLTVGIPFNRWLGMKVRTLSPEVVRVMSPPRKLRENHLKGAHACALALLGEFPAGLLIAQNFSFGQYRIILSELTAQYQKQGRGRLVGEALRPNAWPSTDEKGEIWIDLQTHITNAENEAVALVKTRWQVKPWELVRK